MPTNASTYLAKLLRPGGNPTSVPLLHNAGSKMKRNTKAQNSAPNWAFKPTPTLAMASPFSWPASVPSALSGSGAA